jgi:hypothetical protein
MGTVKSAVQAGTQAPRHERDRRNSGLMQTRRFLAHFVEMCVVMCVGGTVILNSLVFWAVGLMGYSDLRQRSPILALLLIIFNLSWLMVVWMRFRGMAWRPTVEMGGTTLGLGIVLIALAVLGIVPRSSLVAWQSGFCALACVAMPIVMLFRLDLYTGRTGHHHGAHAA